MRHIAVGLLASLAFGGPAIAAHEHAERVPAPRCEPIAKIRAAFAKDPAAPKLIPLTVGQWHWVVGFYEGSAITPPGRPPGNGAILVKGKEKGGGIIWTRGEDACMTVIVVGQTADGNSKIAYMPMPLNEDQVRELDAVKTGAGEVSSAPSNDDELHL